MSTLSILIPNRNEAPSILACLKSIEYLTKNGFSTEIHIGNDHSTDESPLLIQEFIQEKPAFYYHEITECVEQNLKGKANVIHQLIGKTKSEYIAQVDADTFVRPTWLSSMLVTESDMRMGTTIPQIETSSLQNYFFSTWQQCDWLFGQGMCWLFSKIGFPQTAMGNNLIFKRQCYEEIGGYEAISFSVTEDLALFKAFRKNNYSFTHFFNKQSLAFTQPERTFLAWIHQRKRWLKGAWQFANFWKKTALSIELSKLILFLGLIANGWYELILAYITVKYLILCFFYFKLEEKPAWCIALLFCITESLAYFMVGISFVMNKHVIWKKRSFLR